MSDPANHTQTSTRPDWVETLPAPIQQTIAAIGKLSDQALDRIQTTAELTTSRIGDVLAPIAAQPAVQWIAKVPGLDWLLLWLGQVDHANAQADVEKLRADYPTASPDELAQRLIQRLTWQAAQVGLVTNIVPPIALMLFAVDLAAVTKIQAEMAYRLAAIYGLDLADPQRRGEVIAIYGLSMGSGTPLKLGSSFLELIPVIGAATGAVTNATLIYGLGAIAQQFYHRKTQSPAPPAAPGAETAVEDTAR